MKVQGEGWLGRRQYTGLADGDYRFLVRATTAGGVQGAPVQHLFSVDLTPPAVSDITFTNTCAPSALLLFPQQPSPPAPTPTQPPTCT